MESLPREVCAVIRDFVHDIRDFVHEEVRVSITDVRIDDSGDSAPYFEVHAQLQITAGCTQYGPIPILWILSSCDTTVAEKLRTLLNQIEAGHFPTCNTEESTYRRAVTGVLFYQFNLLPEEVMHLDSLQRFHLAKDVLLLPPVATRVAEQTKMAFLNLWKSAHSICNSPVARQ